jgi:His/Glu/Gln/Arg/opine family amino acid ABC transporter permease subunit
MDYSFNFRLVWDKKAYLLPGVLISLQVMAISFCVALVIGLFVGTLLLSKRHFLNRAARVYVEVCRNTPALVQLIWIFYCLPILLNIDINAVLASIVALAINSGAYMSEDFRAGIQAIDKGEVEASRALGMSYRQTMQKIVLPQAFRILIPPLVNHAVSLTKWSSLVSVLGVADLTYRGQYLASETFRPMEIFTAIGIVYFFITFMLSSVVKMLEKRWRLKY